jgi:hypothetical protein
VFESKGAVVYSEPEEGSIRVYYLGTDVKTGIKTFDYGTYRIQPEGSFCTDFDQRYALKNGDEFDCIDSARKWYRCTVISTELIDQSSELTMAEFYAPHRIQLEMCETYPVKSIKFGWRYYDQNGPETEINGEEEEKAFFGYGAEYDEVVGVTSPRVREKGLFSPKVFEKGELNQQ